MSLAVRPARRPMSLRDRAWRVADALAKPLLPPGTLDLISPLRPGADLAGRVERIRLETPDAATLIIHPGASWAGHTPGQYVRVGVEIDGVRHWRTYSLTSLVDSPDGRIAITVKAIPGGLVSNHLVHEIKPGALIHLDDAAGDFIMTTPRPRKVLFITGGSGITPVMGMLRNHLDELPDVVLVHSAPTARDVIFAGDLAALSATGRIRLVTRHTDTDGMLSFADIPAIVPDWAERETWVCGPGGMLDAAQTFYDAAGLAGALHLERFRPHLIAAGDGGLLSFTTAGRTLDGDGATPILETAEASGMLMPSGCRMGICFKCVLPLTEGAVRDLRTGEITYAAPGDGVAIQTCVSAPAGDCQIAH